MAGRSTLYRRSWHGAHREAAIYEHPRRAKRLTMPYLLMILLISAIIGMWGSEFAERWAGDTADTTQPAIAPVSGARPRAISFAICGSGPRINCVVDGDTFWFDGEKIRILDIDTPELSSARCADEERLGEAAKARLRALLNAGTVTLEARGRDRDRYGRLLRTVHVDGTPVGRTLIREGLARPYGGGRRSWCG